MRNLKWVGMAMMAILMGMNQVSCSQENDAVLPEQPAEEYVTVKLGVTGEYLELSESPLITRAEGELKDQIGIHVFELTESGEETYYAHGVFNSLDNVTIKLLKAQKYRFKTSIIVDGEGCKDHLGHNDCNGFGPGVVYTGEDFIYEKAYPYPDSFFRFYSVSGVNGPGTYADCFRHDHFYGELAEYIPTENNATIEINTKRTAYGAHYIVENLDGILTVEVSDTSDELLYTVEISSENPESEGIYTFKDIYAAWSQEDFTTTKILTFSWTIYDGSEVRNSYVVEFKRNVMTTIRFKMDIPEYQNGIVITREDTELTDDEKEYVIDGGVMTEVPVTQE